MRYLLTFLIMLPVMAGDMRVTIKSAKTERKMMQNGKVKRYRSLVKIAHEYNNQAIEIRMIHCRMVDGVLQVATDTRAGQTLANKRDGSQWVGHDIYDHEKGQKYAGVIIQVYTQSGSLLGEVSRPASLLKKLQELQAAKEQDKKQAGNAE